MPLKRFPKMHPAGFDKRRKAFDPKIVLLCCFTEREPSNVPPAVVAAGEVFVRAARSNDQKLACLGADPRSPYFSHRFFAKEFP